MNDYYHNVRIGNLELNGNLFLAPVAGYSDRAFRNVCRECGASFAYTEMVSSEALVRNSDKTETLMLRAPGETEYGVQIFGGDTDVMAQATKIVISKVKPELIDINAGCPVPKILKSGAGASLTRDPDRLYAITKAVCNAVIETGTQIPVTVKIRSGWDSNNLTWKEAALAATEAGAAAITLHARTKAQGYEGYADWSILSELSSLLGNKVPIFGSGDLFSPNDVLKMLKTTGCTGVMFARGAMGNPFIFTQTKEFLTTNNITDIPVKLRLDTGIKELKTLIQDKGETVACREMRKRFCCYSKGITGGASVRKEIVSAATLEDYLRIYALLIDKIKVTT